LIESNEKVNYSFLSASPKNKAGEDAILTVKHSGLTTPFPITAMKAGKEVETQWI